MVKARHASHSVHTKNRKEIPACRHKSKCETQRGNRYPTSNRAIFPKVFSNISKAKAELHGLLKKLTSQLIEGIFLSQVCA
jgi:hypothetical protein